MNNIRIAVVVMQSIVGEIENNINKICSWVKKAAQLNIDIICFPELSITGYTNNSNMASIAISCSSNKIKRIISLAADTDITIMPGMAEKDTTGKIYATHLVVTPRGKVHTYRKIHLAPNEKKFFNSGKSFSLFRINKINIGIQLCYDSHFPELSTSMSLGGADVVFIPHASPRGTTKDKHNSWMRHLPARAFDNGIFVLACNQVGSNGNKLNFPGNALAISPSGRIIGKKLSDDEGMLVVNLKKKQLEHVRLHTMRYFLPNRQPKLYKNIPPVIAIDDS